ncbi:MAG: BatD family protein [Melioribacteraceae bacterium]
MKDYKKFILILILFITGLFINSFAQDFNATVDKTTIGQYEHFQVYFTFNGSDINGVSNFRPPSFQGFKVLSGPNQSTSMQIINNKVSGSLTFSYILMPTSIGEFTIGSASVDYNGKTYRTAPLKITVVKGTSQQQKESSGISSDELSKNVFIVAEASKTRAYLGEQITVTYKLYTKLNIASPQITKLPQYQGFWAEEIEPSQTISFDIEMYKGERYRVATIKRVALFPTKTGTLNVTPFELNIPVIVKRKRTSNDIFDEFFNDSFFGNTQTIEYLAKSNTLKIEVEPLPSTNVPASFNGAVGNFNFKVEVDKNKVKTNESITLRMTVSGSGNIKLLKLPEVQLPAGFEKYEPKIYDNVNKGSIISGQKIVEYLIVPRTPGEKEISPIEFSYFNPAAKKYVTLTSPAFKINVMKGEGQYEPIAGTFSKEDIKLLSEDIRYIKTSDYKFEKKKERALLQSWFWISMTLPLIALFVAVGIRKKQEKLYSNVQLLKYQKAEKAAKKRLKIAKQALDKNNLSEFYSELSLALYGYLEDKLSLQKSEFTIEKALEILSQKNISDDLIARIKNVSDKCEFVRFAPSGLNSASASEIYEEAVKIIVNLESSLEANKSFSKKLTGRMNLFSIIVFVMILMISNNLYPQSPEQLMNLGNKYYQEQKYEDAVQTYQKIVAQGYESAALYYNIGNSYFRLGKLGYAILYYEKALKLAPGDEDISYNLKVANARTVDRITELPKLFIVQWWEILITSLSLNGWALITVIFYLLLLTSIAFYFLSRKINLQRIAFNVGIISIIFFFVSMIILIARYNHEKSTNYGILLEPAYSVKVAPDEKSNDAFLIHEGIKFVVEDNVNNWSKIRLSDGKVGWIPDDKFGRI